MVNTLTVLKTIHVLAATVWVGGGTLLNVGMALAGHSGNPAQRLEIMRLAAFAGNKVFMPMSAILLGTGIWMTAEYYDFGDLWITLGLIGIAITSLIPILYLSPRAKAAVNAMESGAGPPPPGQRNWVPVVARLNLLLLVVIVALMVIRPT
jgi:uncharacterized membrane protein